jgi:hypothetical protein
MSGTQMGVNDYTKATIVAAFENEAVHADLIGGMAIDALAILADS